MTQTQTYTDEEHFFLAATLWGEARGEGVQGMRAVAHVIMNRVRANKRLFGIGVEGVVKKRKQFSCWNPGDANCTKLDRNYLESLNPASPDAKAWRAAEAVASNVLYGNEPDPTKGSLYYHTKAVNPVWNRNLTRTAQIGSHLFFA